jgi:murein DD-endopeptidase MepM/ murein hydrolase activator NlpD
MVTAMRAHAAVALGLLLALSRPSPIAAQAAPSKISVTTQARAVRPGELVILTIAVAEGTEQVAVRAFDRDMRTYQVDGTTWRAIVGVDLAVTPRRYPVTIEARGTGAAATVTHELRVTGRTFATRRLRVDPEFVNPPRSELARITREAAELAALWTSSLSDQLSSDVFVAPVPQAANSAFGVRSVFNGQVRSRHSGADFPSPKGTPVHAPGGGRVVLADALYFSGNTIVIDHGAGVFSLLAHLSEMDVERGDRVDAGDVVGKVGATGRVTGPHLHWAVRANGARVDPLSLLAVLGS